MELRAIRYFLQLCKDLSFTTAASKLFITQQALSKAIRKLENELGVRLFVREASGLTLTEYGEHFRSSMSPLLRKMDKTVEETKEMRDFHNVTIRFGYTYGTASVMHRLIAAFEAQHPQVAILGEERTDLQCENGLQNGDFDMICITEPLEPAEMIQIYEEPVILAVSRGGPFDCDLSAEMLADNVLIDGGEELNVSFRLRDAFKRRGLDLVMKGSSLDKTAFANFVLEGRCANVITQHSSFTENMGFTTRPLPFEEGEVMWRLCIKTGNKDPESALVGELVNFLSRSFRQYYLDFFNDI